MGDVDKITVLKEDQDQMRPELPARDLRLNEEIKRMKAEVLLRAKVISQQQRIAELTREDVKLKSERTHEGRPSLVSADLSTHPTR